MAQVHEPGQLQQLLVCMGLAVAGLLEFGHARRLREHVQCAVAQLEACMHTRGIKCLTQIEHHCCQLPPHHKSQRLIAEPPSYTKTFWYVAEKKYTKHFHVQVSLHSG